MTTSPYDNLPLSKDDNRDKLEYIDVDPEEAAEVPIPAPAQQSPQPQFPALVQQTSRQHARQQSPQPRTSDSPVKIKAQPANPVRTFPFDKQPEYSQLAVSNLYDIYEYILPFEESLLVPDTMPDIGKLLFAEGRANLSGSGSTSYRKNDFLSGTITVFTVYRPAGDTDCPIDTVRSSVPFRTDKCWHDNDNAQFRAEVSIRSVNAEIINERKFTVRGELQIIITEIRQEDLRVLENAGDDALMIARSTVQASDLDFESEEITEISQEITLREGQPSPVKILKESIRITENHRQITSGKLVINATIHSSILYLGEEDDHPSLACITNKTDFTQFILVKNDIDAALIRTSYDTGDLKITIANQDQMLLQGNVTAFIQGCRNRNIPAVTDAYHKIKDISFDTVALPLNAVNSTVSGEISSREVISIDDSETKPETLLCGHGNISEIKASPEKGRVVVEGTLPVKLLALDESDSPFVIETVIPLRGTLELPAAREGLTACIFAYVKDFWFDKINSRQLEVNAGITINIWLCGSENFCTLENLCFAEETAPARRVSMAVYAVGPGDTLWDVAKRYKCDTETLAQLNQIDPEKPLPAGMKLFVMK